MSQTSQISVITSFKTKVIAQLSIVVPTTSAASAQGGGKRAKGKAAKPKAVTKTKEFDFTFEESEENYLAFLKAILTAHEKAKYSPVTVNQRYGFKVLIPPKKALVIYIHLMLTDAKDL
jgi:hypothetical protein